MTLPGRAVRPVLAFLLTAGATAAGSTSSANRLGRVLALAGNLHSPPSTTRRGLI
jgi:hypothetical protein